MDLISYLQQNSYLHNHVSFKHNQILNIVKNNPHKVGILEKILYNFEEVRAGIRTTVDLIFITNTRIYLIEIKGGAIDGARKQLDFAYDFFNKKFNRYPQRLIVYKRGKKIKYLEVKKPLSHLLRN